MDREVGAFLDQFRAALDSRKGLASNGVALKQARRAAANLDRSLAKASQTDDRFSDLANRAEELRTDLDQLLGSGNALGPLIRKAQAMAALEGILPDEIVREVRDLLEEVGTQTGGRRKTGPLPFQVAVDCTDCRKTIVGNMGGSNKWGHIRHQVRQHEKTKHEGFTEVEAVQIRQVKNTLLGDEDAVTEKRYLFRKLTE